MHYILDNVLVQTESVEWCKCSNQDLILLDFQKAYDTIKLDFLFQTMLRIGLPSTFIDFVKILFVGVEVLVCLNGSKSEVVSIERGVHQVGLLKGIYFLYGQGQ